MIKVPKANTAQRFTGGYPPEVLSLTTYEMLEIEDRLIFSANFCHAIFIWGPTGVGKSAIQRQLLKAHEQRCGKEASARQEPFEPWRPAPGTRLSGILEVYGQWGLIDLRLATKDTIDMQGLMNLSEKNACWVPPDDLPVVGQEERFPEKGILFLDEMPLASPPIQAIAYSIALDHKVGSFKLMPGWKVIAAGNLAREKTHAFEMAHPLKNRFLHYFVRCDLEPFKKWAFAHDIDPRVIYFLQWSPDYLHQDCVEEAYGFPTPRSWEMASDLLQHFNNGQRMTNLSAAIGQTAAAVFSGFLDVYEEEMSGPYAQLEKVLSGEVIPPPFTSEEPQRAYAVAARLVGHVRRTIEDCERVFAFCLSDVWESNRELARACLHDLSEALKYEDGRPHEKVKLAMAKHWKRFNEVFRGMQ